MKKKLRIYIHYYYKRIKTKLKGMIPVQYEGTEKLAFFINKFIFEKDRALLVQF
ncbi:IS3 family transposase [Bacillus sp. NPDC094077]|uniref:IS3 family transposase n=1 Tax=Bacillus sp. NPDC094077 TaxID=3390932 RepID=UPI003D02DAB0